MLQCMEMDTNSMRISNQQNTPKKHWKQKTSLQNWGTENLTLSGGFDEMCIEYVLHIHTRLSLQDGTL